MRKMILTTKDGIPCALSNEFKNIPIFKFDIDECETNTEILETVNQYSKYTEWHISRETINRVILVTKDCFGNIQYLTVQEV